MSITGTIATEQIVSPVYFCVWSRDPAALRHEVWRADLMNGANDEPLCLIAGTASYPGIGTIYPTVREMVTGADGHLLIVWMDAAVATDPGGLNFPGPRDGNTARLIKHDCWTGEALWSCDLAAAVRTFEAGATVTIMEHGAIGCGKDGTILVALAGYTVTAGVYQRYLWAITVDPSNGTVADLAHLVTRDPAVAIDATHDVGRCQVFGATWSSDDNFWVVADYKFRDLATTPHEPKEFSGHLYRFTSSDLSDHSDRTVIAEGAAWTVPLRIAHHGSGLLLMPVFYLYAEGTSWEQNRIGMMICSLAGDVVAVKGYSYEEGAVWGLYPHPGGMCGLERTGQRFDIFETNEEDLSAASGATRTDLHWLTDGKCLWRFDTERGLGEPQALDVGGVLGQGADHTYNCHGLARLSNGDVLWLSYEYLDSRLGFVSGTDLRVRLTVADGGSGVMKTQIIKDFASGDPINFPYLPQPYKWVGADIQEFPWVTLAVGAPKAI